MRTALEQHAARLTLEERGLIWESVAMPRSRKLRATGQREWYAAAAFAALLAVVVALEPARQRVSEPVHVAPRLEAVAPTVAAAAPTVAPHRADGIAPPMHHILSVQIAPEVLETPPGDDSPRPTTNLGSVAGRVVDSNNQPVPYANVRVLGMRMGALTDENGNFRIVGLPPATYSLQADPIGYEKQVVSGVRVEADQLASADIQVKAMPVKSIEEISVSARIDTKSSTTKQTFSPLAGVSPMGDLHFRGGRAGEVKFEFPPVVPTTGGSRLPNDEPFDSMFFKNYGVNPFIATDEDRLSTFAVDVDAASYTIARRYLELGYPPPRDEVRVEEFVNFFSQGYPKFDNDDFRILVDGAPSPFHAGYHLLRVGLKGREVESRNRKPARLTFVIDVSGSMAREDRLGLVKQALRVLVDELRPEDRVGIVVFGSNARVLLEPLSVGEPVASTVVLRAQAEQGPPYVEPEQPNGRALLLSAIDQISPEGSTNTEEGLKFGYDVARRSFSSEAINRIILCSDGVANEGRTGAESILGAVRTPADHGIQLSTIGFGMGNYNDVLMEQLADQGDGNHYYVDDLSEANRVFVENLTGTLQVIARDAKVQVEFDTTRVLRYRLLGFENRDVADRDFRNDKVDAGEIGAGHEVTALYEVKLAPQAKKGTLATVRLRYARPGAEGGSRQVREIERRVDASSLAGQFENAAPHLRRDAAVAQFAEILRGSYWAKEDRLEDVLSVAQKTAPALRDSSSTELVTLVQRALALRTNPRH